MMFFFSARKLMLGGQNPDSTVHYQSTQRPPGDPPTQNSVEIKQPLLLWWWEKEQEIETLVLSRTKMLLPQVSVLHFVCTLTCECMCVCPDAYQCMESTPDCSAMDIMAPKSPHGLIHTHGRRHKHTQGLRAKCCMLAVSVPVHMNELHWVGLY